MKISISAFKGTFPRISDRLIPDSAATIAANCRMESGEVRAYRNTPIVKSLGEGDIGTIAKWKAGDAEYWLRFPGDVNLIRSPVADDVWERIYWTGDTRFNEPRMSYTPAAYTGGTDYPATTYKLGVPPPGSQIDVSSTAAATFTVSAIHNERPIRVVTSVAHGLADGELVRFRIVSSASEPGSGDKNDLAEFMNAETFQIQLNGEDDELLLANTDAFNIEYTDFLSGEMDQYFDPALMEVRLYVHTYVTAIGEEGPPSEPSAQLLVTPYQKATLSLPSVGPLDGMGRLIDRRRVYRSSTGSFGRQFQFVAELPISQASWEDDSSVLGETIPSTEWDPPNKDMIGLDISAQGHAVGFFRNVLAFSEPNRVHAWPTSYQLAMDYDIVAIAVIDGGVVVGTTGRPYIVQGIEPRTMLPRRLELNLACVSKRSMVSLGYAAVYASASGLVLVDKSGARLITEGVISSEEWREIGPETIRGFDLSGKYMAIYDGGALLIDPRNMDDGIISMDIDAVSAFHDPREPYLYLLDSGNNILRWDDPDAPKRTWRWRSKVFGLPRPGNMAAARVTANIDDGEVIRFRLVADGRTILLKDISSNEPFWLPGGYLARDFVIDIDGTGDLQMVEIAESMEELEP